MASTSADVIVVGFGGAGSMAALSAAELGAKVLLIEKMETGGGSTHEAGGTIRPPADPIVAARHYAALAEGTTPTEMTRTFAEGEAVLPRRLEELGATLVPSTPPSAPFPWRRRDSAYPGTEGSVGLGTRLRVSGPPGQPGGESLWNLLAERLRAARVDIALGQRMTRLVRDEVSGAVTSLEVRSASGERDTLTARLGIVLCCGGFGHDATLKRSYLGADIGALSPAGRATGDGIRAALSIGADLWHMNAVSCTFGYRFPGHEPAFYAQMPANAYIIVDARARRFIDESQVETHSAFNALAVRDPSSGRHERIPSFVIFDEHTRCAGRIFNTANGANRHFDWSADNSFEVERGWIKIGASPEALAVELGLDPTALAATVGAFNDGIESAADPFGRSPERSVPLCHPPYYGLPIYPALLNTQGGPRRNERAQVIDPFNEPIPGLYSAGELGSLWGPLYPGSGNVAEALIFSQIAAHELVDGPNRRA